MFNSVVQYGFYKLVFFQRLFFLDCNSRIKYRFYAWPLYLRNRGIIIVGMIILLNVSISAQDDINYNIKKCATLEGGLIIHFPDDDFNSVATTGASFQYCYGLKVAERVGIGLGTGFHYFENESYVPIYLNMVYFLNGNKKCSFVFFDGGYSLGWSDKIKEYLDSEFSGGLSFNVGFGKKIWLLEQFSVFLKAGYHYQNIQLKYENVLEQSFDRKFHFHMFVLTLGLMLEQ